MVVQSVVRNCNNLHSQRNIITPQQQSSHTLHSHAHSHTRLVARVYTFPFWHLEIWRMDDIRNPTPRSFTILLYRRQSIHIVVKNCVALPATTFFKNNFIYSLTNNFFMIKSIVKLNNLHQIINFNNNHNIWW